MVKVNEQTCSTPFDDNLCDQNVLSLYEKFRSLLIFVILWARENNIGRVNACAPCNNDPDDRTAGRGERVGREKLIEGLGHLYFPI